MDIKRMVLYFAVALMGVFLWTTWQKDYPPPTVQKTATTQTQRASEPGSFTPSTYAPSATVKVDDKKTSPQMATRRFGQIIPVKTDVLDLGFSSIGADLVSAKLLDYSVSLKDKQPIQLLSPLLQNFYVAQSGVTNTTKAGHQARVRYGQPQILKESDGSTKVVFAGKTEHGVSVTKTYLLKPKQYDIQQQITVTNNGGSKWSGSVFNQLTRRNVKPETSFHSRSYFGASISSPDKPYEKLKFDDLNDNNVNRNIQGGWIAMQQQYFLSAWIPNKKDQFHYYSNAQGDGKDGEGNFFTLGYVSPGFTLKPGASVTTTSQFYVGPEIAKNLKPLANGLSLTIDYGWLWMISVPIFKVMQWIQHYVHNWGWTIVLITILIKLLFYGLSNKSYRSMAKMREMQPRLEALRKRHEGDRQALGKATMEFYKKEKVNPMGGCLPMLIQVPVFIALYFVLIESVQLRQAPFIFWIHDLSVKDPFYVLPILMGASMFLQQKISPPPPDPTQAKVMMLLPVVFTVFFLTFPAGLVLYWLVNNVLSISQQWYVMKTYDPKADIKKHKRKKKK